MNQDIYLPLHQKKSWDEANRSVLFLLAKYQSRMHHIQTLAGDISDLFFEIFPVLSGLCAQTCLFCPDPCCMNAKIWFDLKDILFLQLNRITIPASQPLGGPDEICRYLGSKGCKLERIERPFICTRYLCPPQMSLLRQDPRTEQQFSGIIQLIKTRREEIEREFIEMTGNMSK